MGKKKGAETAVSGEARAGEKITPKTGWPKFVHLLAQQPVKKLANISIWVYNTERSESVPGKNTGSGSQVACYCGDCHRQSMIRLLRALNLAG